MNSIRIKVGNPERAVELVRIAERYPQKITIQSDNFNVNAKSLLGVFAIGMNGTCHLDISEKDDGKLHDMLLQFAPFIVSGSN